MLKIRNILIGFGLLFCSVAFADVQVSIGINIPVYPQLVVVPGYPVYYAPQLQSNYFFYDGLYWVFQDDNWYESSWYNGPWWFVDPEDVPLFILRVPVRYYRRPPTFFLGWNSVSPPRWGDHWGHDWDSRRSGWDRWDRRVPHTPAPLPSYQQQYSGDRYPHQVEQQHELQKKSYRFEPHDPLVQQHYQQQEVRRTPAQQINSQQENPQQEKQRAPEEKAIRQRDSQHSAPNQQATLPEQGRSGPQKSQPEQRVDQRSQQRNVERDQQNLKLQSQKKQQNNDDSNERNQDHGQMRDRGRND